MASGGPGTDRRLVGPRFFGSAKACYARRQNSRNVVSGNEPATGCRALTGGLTPTARRTHSATLGFSDLRVKRPQRRPLAWGFRIRGTWLRGALIVKFRSLANRPTVLLVNPQTLGMIIESFLVHNAKDESGHIDARMPESRPHGCKKMASGGRKARGFSDPPRRVTHVARIHAR